MATRDHRAAAILYQSERQTLVDVDTTSLKALESSAQVIWVETISEGIQTGRMRNVDPRIAYFLFRDALFLVARWYRDSGRLDLEEITARYLDLICHGLLTPDSSADRPETTQ
ncbi:hypothetical protein MNQ99_18575 (plasmid) [Arthrobacter sulfonylureivorans]|uniref:HTH-type transcriptional repressor KstR2 C-terminal domain-containing protein n=2 Tax=Arthrobacter sulfonylureivorans TaxID=2486855 RepID=A0ABY3WH54_9MICC|nr:hypothetical protein [Arthrobacter sulfonylureivorans]UNK47888.1 hypothetical protein MNQ99_18575 [Arthrobacter sulfonylureivorans]